MEHDFLAHAACGRPTHQNIGLGLVLGWARPCRYPPASLKIFCHTSPESRDTMPGYSDLAAYMVSRADTSMFRRFSALNTESLLHMQAELLGLELAVEEIRQDTELNNFDVSWLSAPYSDSNAVIGGLFDKLRNLLDAYCKELHSCSNHTGLTGHQIKLCC